MTYTKNISRKQNFEKIVEILEHTFQFEIKVTYRWDKNNWVTYVQVRPEKTKSFPRDLLLKNKKLPVKMIEEFKKAGFKIIKFHNWENFHPGLWSTDHDNPEIKYTTLNLCVGIISEKFKWRLERI